MWSSGLYGMSGYGSWNVIVGGMALIWLLALGVAVVAWIMQTSPQKSSARSKYPYKQDDRFRHGGG